jgi:hypothetical protein
MTAITALCLHCRSGKSMPNCSRGICQACYRDVGIRKQYPLRKAHPNSDTSSIEELDRLIEEGKQSMPEGRGGRV